MTDITGILAPAPADFNRAFAVKIFLADGGAIDENQRLSFSRNFS
jgi:hypothetical protein